MKHILILRCTKGHEQRLAHDERYSRDVVRAFGVFYCGGSALGIEDSDGNALEWPEGRCRVAQTLGESETVRVVASCGEPMSFEIEEVTP